MAYAHLPVVETSHPHERLQALKDAKELMSGNGSNGGIIAAFAGNTKAAPGTSAEAIDGFIRLAEYITTGHDYADTHPKGKRRPIINRTDITVVAPPLGGADMEHLLHHLQDGSFAEFMEKEMKSGTMDAETFFNKPEGDVEGDAEDKAPEA